MINLIEKTLPPLCASRIREPHSIRECICLTVEHEFSTTILLSPLFFGIPLNKPDYRARLASDILEPDSVLDEAPRQAIVEAIRFDSPETGERLLEEKRIMLKTTNLLRMMLSPCRATQGRYL